MKTCLIIATLCLLSCTRSIVKVNPPTSTLANRVPLESRWSHSFVYGLAYTDKSDAAQICGGANKVVRIENKKTFMNGLIQALTVSFYIPRTIEYYCND